MSEKGNGHGHEFEAAVDVVVAGSGVAGLTAARALAAAGLDVLVITKAGPDDANTTWAQGGVAVVRDQFGEHDPGDTVEAHVQDTLAAGAGLADPAAVAAILSAGAGAIARLRAAGAVFDASADGTLLRTREGGHHADRVIHAGGDATGAEIERALLAAPGLPAILTGHLLVDVLPSADGSIGSIAGALVLGPDGTRGVIRCGAVVLATGGSGQLFAATTNPSVATGDGLAIALRAGATLADAEFVQFHPTVLYTGPADAGQRPLVTEAVRGAGAVLIDGSGARVMTGVHPLADLAPRDVVSLAITRRLAEAPGVPGGVSDHVFLDATAIPAATFARRFPTVTAACARAGIVPWRDPIPVAPAAHYQCGGVLTDLDGRTSVAGLYAVGEVARTGLHGANRLASNSLLEGLVMGERAADAVEADLVGSYLSRGYHRWRTLREVSAVPGVSAVPSGDSDHSDVRGTVQTTMSRAAGIGRSAAGMAEALASIRGLRAKSIQDANLVLVSTALLTAAIARDESRGCHVRTDVVGLDPAQASSTALTLRDGEFTVSPLRPGWTADWANAPLAAAG